MVKIRLMRMGMKGAPSYRIVVADVRSPRDGRIIENIGWYNPLTEPSTITVDAERAKHWLSVGAQPTDSVRSLLTRAGVLQSIAQAAKAARAAQPEKPAKAEKPSKVAKPAKAEKAEKVEKPAKAEKAEKPETPKQPKQPRQAAKTK